MFTGELLKLETLPGPFLVDNMKDEASRAYGSFPDRLYIVLDGIIVYQVLHWIIKVTIAHFQCSKMRIHKYYHYYYYLY